MNEGVLGMNVQVSALTCSPLITKALAWWGKSLLILETNIYNSPKSQWAENEKAVIAKKKV